VVESHSLCFVLRNTLTILKHESQLDLSDCMSLLCCKAKESRSLNTVLRNTLALHKH
jgi:hypothetical protein